VIIEPGFGICSPTQRCAQREKALWASDCGFLSFYDSDKSAAGDGTGNAGMKRGLSPVIEPAADNLTVGGRFEGEQRVEVVPPPLPPRLET
jgi:hypothetical protein